MKASQKELDVPTEHLVDFNMLSKMGLVYIINKEILHKFGLALSYNPGVGDSDGAIISGDGKWEYTPETNERGLKKFEDFKHICSEQGIQRTVELYKEQA